VVAFDGLGLSSRASSRAVTGLLALNRTEVCCLQRGGMAVGTRADRDGIIQLYSWKKRVIVAV
jgi:hypothetical protein